jgi:hypothetical protein
LAEVRVLAAAVGVRTIAIRGQDLLLRSENPAATAERLRAAAPARSAGDAAIRVLPPPSGERLSEVYFRPPPNSLEPETLLAVLRRRLGSTAEAACSEAAAPRAHRTRT